MMGYLIAVAALAAVIVWACARASGEADAHAERLCNVSPGTINCDADADMLREAMEEEHW